MGYLRRQVLTAALTANVLRPSRNPYVAASGFFPGWLAGELAPHLLALTAADTTRAIVRGRPSRAGLALSAASAAGLAIAIAESHRSVDVLEAALEEGLGVNYRDRLADLVPGPDPVTPISKLVWPFRFKHPDVKVLRNVRYSEHGKRGLLDVYLPRHMTPTKAPALLQVHGGGWVIGNKEEQGVPLMTQMAAAGWVCFAINYRRSPQAKWPDHVADVKAAIGWIREHADEYGVDPSFLAITGGSAGGHLAALTALSANDPEFQPGFEDVDTTVQACVPHYGVYDLAGATGHRSAIDMRDRFLAQVLFRTRYDQSPEVFEQASPYLRVTADAPPFFVLHGVNDTLVDVRQARDFVTALREVAKKPVVYAELARTQHAFDVFPSIRSQHAMRAVDRFLRFTYAESQT